MKKWLITFAFVLAVVAIGTFSISKAKNDEKTGNIEATENIVASVPVASESEEDGTYEDASDENTESATEDLIEEEIDETTEEEPVEEIYVETSWAYDVSNSNEVYKNNQYFAKVKVVSKSKDKFLDKSHPTPTGLYNVEVLEVLKGGKLPKKITISFVGGQVSYSEYISTMDKTTASKCGFDKLNTSDLKKQILIADNAYYRLKANKVYYVSIDKPEDLDYYAFMVGGYAVFEEKKGSLYNVITGKKLNKKIN